MVTPLRIAGRLVGPGEPCFVIAEAGVNHNGRGDLARRLIDAAAEAGADAIKFQTFTAEKLLVAEAPKAAYQTETTDPAESQLEMIKQLELSRTEFEELSRYCREKNILFLSTPFDEESADFLEGLGMAAFKIPSGEITNTPLLAHIARKRRPMVISTGMSSLTEVGFALQCVRAAGCGEVALLQCVSNYPAAPEDVNLKAMSTMTAKFDVVAGYSDHADGTAISLAAVALGACILEKHLTLDRALPGPDHRVSLEPHEFKRLMQDTRAVEASLGHGRKEPAASEANTTSVARRSLVAASTIPAETLMTEDLITLRRPGTGLPPARRVELVGRKTRVVIPEGALLTLEMFA